MNRAATLSTVMFIAVIAGCAGRNEPPSLTPLEIQSLQTRDFEHPKKIVFASVMSVFQDLGYTIQTASMHTGLITAESAADSDKGSKFWWGISKVSQTRATAFIEEIGPLTKVRLSFVVTTSKSYVEGQTDRQDKPILDANIYQNAFERIDSAIFVRSGNE